MTGIKVAGAVAIAGYGAGQAAAIISPSDLQGLNSEALSTVITLASLGVMVYFIKSLVPVLKDLVIQITKLVSKLEARPCVAADQAELAARTAAKVVFDATLAAEHVLLVAKAEAEKLKDRKP